MRKLAPFIMMLLTVTLVSGQEFQVPKNYKLDKKEDYAKYEKDVVACVDYLERTPLDDKSELTKQANAFLLKWIMGSPSVIINVQPYITSLTKKNPGLILIFLGGWTKYALQNPKEIDDLSGNLAGMQSVLKVYQQKKGIKREEKLEELITLDKKGELVDWLKVQINNTDETSSAHERN